MATAEGQKCAADNGLLFIETSAKTSDHVDTAFLDTATQIYNKVEKGEIDISSEVGWRSAGVRREAGQLVGHFEVQGAAGRRPGLEEDCDDERREKGRMLLTYYNDFFEEPIH